jgi:hypothetical protein
LVLSKEYIIFKYNKKKMAATSKHYGDIAIWVEKVINSSETYQQCISAKRLMYIFEAMLNKDTKLEYSDRKNLLIRAEVAYHSKFDVIRK